MKNQKKRIESIRLKSYIDDSPDTSWMGEYSNERKPFAIVAVGGHTGDFAEDVPEDELPEGGHNYLYFNPVVENYKGAERAEIEKWCKADFERMQRLNCGDFCFLGIKAEAAILLPYGKGSFISQKLSSGGLWGIESDSNGYAQEVAKEQLVELKAILAEVGFTKSQISRACAKAIDETDNPK